MRIPAPEWLHGSQPQTISVRSTLVNAWFSVRSIRSAESYCAWLWRPAQSRQTSGFAGFTTHQHSLLSVSIPERKLRRRLPFRGVLVYPVRDGIHCWQDSSEAFTR